MKILNTHEIKTEKEIIEIKEVECYCNGYNKECGLCEGTGRYNYVAGKTGRKKKVI